MQEYRKSGIYIVGFIDPNVIHEECVRQYPNRTENNLVMSLEGVAKMASHAIFQYNVLVIDIDNTTLGLI